MNFKALIKPYRILMLVGIIASVILKISLIDFENAEYLYCLLSVATDIILALGVYAFVKREAGIKRAVIGFLISLFLPTMLFNTVYGGSYSAFYISVLIWALYLLRCGKVKLSFLLLGVSAALNYQTVFILPFFIFVYISGLIGGKKSVRLYHFGLTVCAPVIAFIVNILRGKSVADIMTVYLDRVDGVRLISYNYPGIWSLLHISYSDAAWCIGFTLIALIAVTVFLIKMKADVSGRHFIWCAFILTYTCVMFLPEMHERASFLYEILVLILAFSNGFGWIAVFAFQMISLKTYNATLFHGRMDADFLAIVNSGVYAFMFFLEYRELIGKPLTSDLFSLAEDRTYPYCRFASKENVKPGRKDFLAMALLAGIFLLIGSMHLGRSEAPSTYETFGTECANGNEIYVTLPAIQDVSSVCIYSVLSGKESFELYYAEDGEWKEIEEDLSLKGVFTWRQVSVDVRTHQFCIIFQDPKVQIAEVAVMDAYGNRIDLLDDCEPAALFDEQKMLPSMPTAYDSMIFDEVYHGRTAYEFTQGMSIYEDTHPPLGKTLISLGIRLFGMNPFGYRIIVLLFGVMCIPVMYLLALRITKDSRYAILAGVLQITEFMHFVLSRISTIDIIVAFFILCMFYGCVAFLYEEKYRYLVFSGAAFALGIATKWTAAYAAAGLALILFIWMIGKIRKKSKASDIVKFVLICLGSFIVFPAIVYVLSYIPFVKVYPNKNLIEHAISNSIHMFEYHSNVTAEHPYSSPWYSWLIDWHPLTDFRLITDGYKSVIATFVNPFVCFAGLLSVIHHAYLAIRKKDNVSAVLLVFYISMLLPWVFITRTVFIYQYFVCTKVLILMICRSIQCIGFKKEESVIRFSAAVSGTLFVLFFPVLSGILFNYDYVDKILTVLPDWWF